MYNYYRGLPGQGIRWMKMLKDPWLILPVLVLVLVLMLFFLGELPYPVGLLVLTVFILARLMGRS